MIFVQLSIFMLCWLIIRLKRFFYGKTTHKKLNLSVQRGVGLAERLAYQPANQVDPGSNPTRLAKNLIPT